MGDIEQLCNEYGGRPDVLRDVAGAFNAFCEAQGVDFYIDVGLKPNDGNGEPLRIVSNRLRVLLGYPEKEIRDLTDVATDLLDFSKLVSEAYIKFK